MIGFASCTVNSVTNSQIICTIGLNAAGSFPVIVQVLPNGYANMDITFDYYLNVSSFSPLEGRSVKTYLKLLVVNFIDLETYTQRIFR